ncbi:MAG: hydantoinase/oxoprolinase family protein [Candidatus Thorarchaeota archaeon]
MLFALSSKMIAIGVDVGGTFTDIIVSNIATGRSYVHKIPSTPDSQDSAVVSGVSEILSIIGLDSKDVTLVVHGTTVATNAMLQRKGADVLLLTTSGLEDVLEIARQNRQEIYDFTATRPKPLVDRKNRIGVKERIDSEGQPVIQLKEGEIERVQSILKSRKPEAVAISLLFSYVNPSHEAALMNALQDSSNAYLVASSKVLPEFREYERTSTTVLEAYLGPLVLNYLKRLDTSIKAVCQNANLTVMQSNGGTVLCSRTHGKAIGLAISGLAGGVIGGWEISRRAGLEHAITLDMGGTSCDISAVSERVVVRPDNEVGGLPVRMPSVDVKTIGAGGGSIAWIDSAGVLHVGPQSAGANPGPVSYGKGGTEATITDANLILGRLNPDFFVGGKIKLRMDLARDAVGLVANNLSLPLDETALGIIRISTSNMVQAIREVTVERGRDPRDFALVPFGGAGPTQAIDIATALGIDAILIPPNPGITSALGLLCADLRVDVMRTVMMSGSDATSETIKAILNDLSVDASAQILEQGALKDNIVLQWSLDMRYSGQSYELNIPIPHNAKDIVHISMTRFETEHEASYGYRMKDREIQLVTARVTARHPQAEWKSSRPAAKARGEPVGIRDVVIGSGKKAQSEIYRRNTLCHGQIILGPAIIEQLDTTTYIAPHWKGEVERNGSLWLRREANC